MIISHKHKFIFIKTRKTAGTSIEIALSKICGPDDIITPITEEDEEKRIEIGGRSPQNYYVPYKYYLKEDWARLAIKGKRKKFYNHMPATEIINYIPQSIWNSYFKFAFERNPWDKLISWYYWRNKGQYNSIYDFIKGGMMDRLNGYDQYSIDSIPIADRVYKFEKMTEAFDDISEKLELNTVLSLPTYRAKGNIRQSKMHYSKVLKKEEVELTRKIFAREIEFMNYTY